MQPGLVQWELPGVAQQVFDGKTQLTGLSILDVDDASQLLSAATELSIPLQKLSLQQVRPGSLQQLQALTGLTSLALDIEDEDMQYPAMVERIVETCRALVELRVQHSCSCDGKVHAAANDRILKALCSRKHRPPHLRLVRLNECLFAQQGLSRVTTWRVPVFR